MELWRYKMYAFQIYILFHSLLMFWRNKNVFQTCLWYVTTPARNHSERSPHFFLKFKYVELQNSRQLTIQTGKSEKDNIFKREIVKILI